MTLSDVKDHIELLKNISKNQGLSSLVELMHQRNENVVKENNKGNSQNT
jgi:hypothetical protein